MNKYQIRGIAKEIVGKFQEGVGKLVVSKAQRAKGLEKQVEGKAEKKIGDAKEVLKNITITNRS